MMVGFHEPLNVNLEEKNLGKVGQFRPKSEVFWTFLEIGSLVFC